MAKSKKSAALVVVHSPWGMDIPVSPRDRLSNSLIEKAISSGVSIDGYSQRMGYKDHQEHLNMQEPPKRSVPGLTFGDKVTGAKKVI